MQLLPLGRWWKKGPYKILCFAPEEGVDRRDHLKRMPWLHFVFLGVTVSVPPVQYLIEEYRIGKCVGLRSVGAGVKGLVLGSVMFNGLAIAHDFDEQRLGWAMSTCDHDPKPPSPLDDAESYSDWERRDPLEAGPDLVDSRPMVLQNRYFSNGAYVLSKLLQRQHLAVLRSHPKLLRVRQGKLSK